jgi:hypothetical protein
VTGVQTCALPISNPRWFIGIIGLTRQAFVTWNWSQGLGGSTRTFQFVRGGYDGGGNAFRALPEGRALVLSGTLPEPPRLDLTLLNGQIQITWSTNQTGYALESVPTLPATNWLAITNPITVSGTQFVVTVDTNQPGQFFRLRKN